MRGLIIRTIVERISPWLARAMCERSGAAAVEFAIVAPMLLLVLTGIVQFGLTFNNYIELTNAVRVGGRQFAISRSSSTPWSTSKTALTSSAVNLDATKITVTFKVNNTTCTSNSSCQTALAAAPGGSASVSATYPCDLTIMGIDFHPSCTLSSQNTEYIE
ncbi:MAG: TadE family protein [Alphaproteobacteria bacterium]